MVLTERDGALLADLFLHRAMSRGQVEARHFGSVKRANARLRLLFDHGFVLRSYPGEAPYGAQAVYSIAMKAAPLVADRLGMSADNVRQLTRKSPTPRFRDHALAVVDFALRLDAKARGSGLELVRWVPEILCRHEYEVRQAGGGPWRRQIFRPDGSFRLAQGERFRDAFLEMDLGHTGERQFQDKLAGFATFVDAGVYGDAYGGEEPALLVQTTGARRLAHLAAISRRFPRHRVLLATTAEIAAQGPLAPVWHTHDGKVTEIWPAQARGPPR
jgi:hypothetical protein